MAKNSNNTPPKLMLQKNFLLRSVLFVSLFSILFMVIYQPFSQTAWFGLNSWRQVGITVLFYVFAISTLILSKFILLSRSKSREISLNSYFAWHIAEFVAIATEYYLFSLYFRLGLADGTPKLLFRITCCVALILAIPYSIIWIYAQYKAKKEELEMFKATHSRDAIENGHQLIQFRDSQGKLRMSLSQDTIFYIESQDNYVQIFYELEGKLSSYLLRCSTQKVEEALTGTDIVRCRRSLLVNTSKIVRCSKDRGRLTISLAEPSDKTVTVTPAYYRAILSKVESTVQH